MHDRAGRGRSVRCAGRRRQRARCDSRLAGVLLADHSAQVAALLAEPLADGLTRGEALRWGALLHDAAKPLTRDVRPADGRVTFIGHDERGAELAREVLGRLRCSERLRAHVAALVRNHLRLGFLVHEPQPLSRRTVFGYLRACSPVEVDVTLLSVADRLATRGDRATESIEAHLHVARPMLSDALRWRADGPPRPLLRGDELARELGIPTGPQVGELLTQLSEAQFAGEISTREQALDLARTAGIDALAARDPNRLALMRDPDCIFCKIVAGELPATIVDEDERTISFMDIAPATRGHALVIPREHSPDLLSVGAEDLAAVAPGRQAAGRAREGAPAGRRRQPAERLRRGRLSDGVPLPRARDPALRGRSAAASVGA